jgi:cytochrome P450
MIDVKVHSRSVRALPPGPQRYPLIGVLPQLLRNPLETFTSAARKYGGVVRLGTYRPGGHVILISHPGPLKYVLQERHRAYERAADRFVRLIGYSLPTLTGESWLERRRLLQPVFHTKYLIQFASAMTDKATAMTEQWQGPAARGEALDIAVEMSKLTRDIIVRILFGLDLAIDSSETTALERSLTIAMTHVSLLNFVNPLPQWVPTPGNRAFEQALQTFNRVVYRIIDERRQNPVGQRDLMTLLLNARDQETGKGMNDQQLRDEVLTMFVAGHETTANTLAWTWYLLSLHPEVERRLHAEVDEVLGGRPPTMDDLPRLIYTRMVVMESMRLYPAGWLDTRSLQADEEDEIDGYTITRKSLLFYSPYVTHRLPELWENPDAFDPERFAPERVTKLPQFTYIPFGAGPRQCIGKNLAEMEAHLILATVAQHYRLQLVPGTRVELEPATTLRPRNGLPMIIRSRGKNWR